MVRKKVSGTKPKLSKLQFIAVGAATTAIGASLLLTFGNGKSVPVPSYMAV